MQALCSTYAGQVRFMVFCMKSVLGLKRQVHSCCWPPAAALAWPPGAWGCFGGGQSPLGSVSMLGSSTEYLPSSCRGASPKGPSVPPPRQGCMLPVTAGHHPSCHSSSHTSPHTRSPSLPLGHPGEAPSLMSPRCWPRYSLPATAAMPGSCAGSAWLPRLVYLHVQGPCLVVSRDNAAEEESPITGRGQGWAYTTDCSGQAS